MQRRFARSLVEGTAERLTIESHRFAGQRMREVPRPRFQGRIELDRIESGKHFRERIVRGDAVFKREKLAEPRQLALAKFRNVDPRVAIANRAAQGHEHHFDQRIVGAAIDAWIGNLFKLFANLTNESRRHWFDILASKRKTSRLRSEAFTPC